MKLIVAGGRDFDDYDRLANILDKTLAKFPTLEVVCGLAKGADTLGAIWARMKGIPVVEFPADWDLHGKAAGHIRNRQMGDYATHLIAFWDGGSKGTKGMIDYMEYLGKPYHVYIYNTGGI